TSIDASKAIALMAVDVSTPGQNLQTAELKAGVHRKIVDGRNTGELNITFRCSSDMTERKLFDAWMSLIYRDNGTVAYYDEYTSSGVDIFSLTNNGGQTYRVSMEEAYPATLTELPFNTEQENGVLMFQVTFNYRRLHNTALDTAPVGVVQSFAFSPINAEVTATSLPSPPPTNNLPTMIFDIYKNIDRIKVAIENGTLSKTMGQKLILNLMRDLNGAGLDTGVSNTALKYANDLLYALGRK
ncbi:MAG TPA: hypothetical protein VIR31_07200, partial [Nitrososphaeraceae archaeon]